MFRILDEVKDMIKMQGGNGDDIRDIALAIKTLKKLMIENQSKPQQSYQPRHEDRRRERHNEEV